jgi:hypothetical protein
LEWKFYKDIPVLKVPLPYVNSGLVIGRALAVEKTSMGDRKPGFRLTLLPRNIQLQPTSANQIIR